MAPGGGSTRNDGEHERENDDGDGDDNKFNENAPTRKVHLVLSLLFLL